MNSLFITQQQLNDYGIYVDKDENEVLIEHLNETLEERVGAEIIDELNDKQLAKYLQLQQGGSNEDIASWLEQNVPDLKGLVQDEIDILLGELAENVDFINQKAQK
jgi:hypothetical protein